MALIFYFSSLPHVPIPSLFHSQDFYLHIFEYSVLGYLLSIAFASTGLRRGTGLYAVLFTLLYGASDELHQVFVPLRDPSLGDIIADSLGGALGMFVYHAFSNAERRRDFG
jgi:VanZ family protein